jgi:ATP-dependent Clp protease ATP-binding subunit ClpC
MLSNRYITDRYFPDKAIDILDELGSEKKISVKVPEEIEKLKADIEDIKLRKLEIVKEQKYELAARLRDEEKTIIRELDSAKEKWNSDMNENKILVSVDDVYEMVTRMTSIPVSRVGEDESNKLLQLETNLKSAVIGQDDAIKEIVNAIYRQRIGIKDPNKPISYIFLGSTGVGKTHLAKTLAKELFGSKNNLIRFDMSEFQERHSVSRLLGAPPGYVGYEEGGQLTEQVKNKPYSIILFDEIEKAHKDVFSSLLQILDDGHMTDGLGKTINFKNCIIIMTSNLGVKKVQDFGQGIGFGSNNLSDDMKKNTIQKELKKFFAPEFLNRIDDIVVFNSLKGPEVEKICKIELGIVAKRINELGYKFKFADSIIKMIAKVGFDELYGARPLKRAIQDKIENVISVEILKGNVVKDEEYEFECSDDGKITYK